MRAITLVNALAALEEVKAATYDYGEIDAQTASHLWLTCMRAAAALRAGLTCELPDLVVEKPEKERQS